MHKKIIFSEGLFLQPHHFQRMAQSIDERFELNFELYHHQQYGLIELLINQSKLQQQLLEVVRLKAIMPDGTPIYFDESCDGLLSLSIDPELRDQVVYLAIKPNNQCRIIDSEDAHSSRYRKAKMTVLDLNTGENPQKIELAYLNLKLSVTREEGSLYLPICQLRQVKNEHVILDTEMIPPSLCIGASKNLLGYLDRATSLCRLRQHELSKRLKNLNRSTLVGIKDWLLLQIVNRHYLALELLTGRAYEDPYRLFELISIATSELATYTLKSHRVEAPVCFARNKLAECFSLLFEQYVAAMNIIKDATAIKLPLNNQSKGVWECNVEPNLRQYQRWVLMVSLAALDSKSIPYLVGHLKVAPKGYAPDIVSLQVSGLPLKLLSIAPRELPDVIDAVYFELDTTHELFEKINLEGALSIYLGGQHEVANMELWAISLGVD